ncbi:hypothetical protein Natoc_1288 [Natronococcus occultus SP4]|uniref:Uncharacterized protein n=1 Tax=Natronococcus occultus SP4 TaxID=694430 RepID=L0JWF9_9EURY|nr:hypothetical protein Natoc_1288 [Natronococcus occultus SP4]
MNRSRIDWWSNSCVQSSETGSVSISRVAAGESGGCCVGVSPASVTVGPPRVGVFAGGVLTGEWGGVPSSPSECVECGQPSAVAHELSARIRGRALTGLGRALPVDRWPCWSVDSSLGVRARGRPAGSAGWPDQRGCRVGTARGVPYSRLLDGGWCRDCRSDSRGDGSPTGLRRLGGRQRRLRGRLPGGCPRSVGTQWVGDRLGIPRGVAWGWWRLSLVVTVRVEECSGEARVEVLGCEAAFGFDVLDPVVDALVVRLEVVASGSVGIVDDVDGFVGGSVDVVCALGVDADENVVRSVVSATASRNGFGGVRLYTHMLVRPARGRCATTGLRVFRGVPCLFYSRGHTHLTLRV